MRGSGCAPFLALLVALPTGVRAQEGTTGGPVRPDLLITAVWPGPAATNRLCVGGANRLYVTVRRQGGTAFRGPIEVWLSAREATGAALPAGGVQRIEYVNGVSSWLVVFRDIPVLADWRGRSVAFTIVVNPEIDGRRPIAESNYNNNGYTLPLEEHTEWSRRCS